jgi:hypothetical protein
MIGDGFLGELDHGLQLPVVWQTPERGSVSQMSQKTRRDLEPAPWGDFGYTCRRA